ncbi:hypothetical protein DUI87_15332 [Hirundo rustica rustica]|uniref:Uncharacterized protein n=1 Tax=Hirundo rustica rustica TaxID=333673 RepID=A0A3M0K3T5_HIRRU|nr:hypothetical protein DUI87_15332 [Hirundo rustica rustica]
MYVSGFVGKEKGTERESVRANQSLQGRHRSTCKGKECSVSTEAPWQYSNPSSSSIDQSRLTQAALGKGEAPEHLQYINDIIVSGNTAREEFEKGEKIIHILLEAAFAIKKSKVKGPCPRDPVPESKVARRTASDTHQGHQ